MGTDVQVRQLHFVSESISFSCVISNSAKRRRQRTPVQALGPHVAALGMRFYTGKMFPSEYRNSIFIAERGSWNRDDKIGRCLSFSCNHFQRVIHKGYRVVNVKLGEDNRTAIDHEIFATVSDA